MALATGKADGLSGRFISVWDDLNDLVHRADQIVEGDLLRVRLRT